MGALFIGLLTFLLILISGFVVLLVLMQRTSQSGGMGAALGGGAAESAFGSSTNNVLRDATIYATIAFFVVSLGLYLIYQAKAGDRVQNLDARELIGNADPEVAVPDTVEEPADSATLPEFQLLPEAGVPEVDVPEVDAVPGADAVPADDAAPLPTISGNLDTLVEEVEALITEPEPAAPAAE